MKDFVRRGTVKGWWKRHKEKGDPLGTTCKSALALWAVLRTASDSKVGMAEHCLFDLGSLPELQ
ncbi:MAG: hypothetical protein DRQ10_05995 [Candidatus Hydrothermota bacterium]|nr:MAG: hypothetical protein DRQ10_05995 [Candidatus Hydrothermae bacterium]